ncbi:MAG TPA: GLPGLI family protein [Mucilaginibacter sp.]|jgi:GLPGLI family protein|nr:GLPGLI family protein [Mucilaginibacter sp.]
MKPIFFSFCLLMSAIFAYAQEPDKALIKVQYNLIHIRDTTQKNKPYTESMVLIAGKNSSWYTSYDKMNLIINNTIRSVEARNSGTPISVPLKPTSSFLQEEYYYYFNEHKFISKEALAIQYLVDEDNDKINWNILKDTLSFSGIACQKAITTFKGRNWIAWFATDLPFSTGPWKLNGLPGLILEAYDNKKEVQFKFGGIENIKPGDLLTDNAHSLPDYMQKGITGVSISTVPIPKEQPGSHGGPVKISQKEYEKLKAASDKDPEGFKAAQYASFGISIPRSSSNGSQSSVQKPPVANINNPIELSKK